MDNLVSIYYSEGSDDEFFAAFKYMQSSRAVKNDFTRYTVAIVQDRDEKSNRWLVYIVTYLIQDGIIHSQFIENNLHGYFAR